MLFSILLCLAVAGGCLLSARLLLHYFQLESYQFPGYFRTLRRNLPKAVLPGLCMGALLTVLLVSLGLLWPEGAIPWAACLAVCAALAAGGWAIGRLFSEKKAKKPFVFTARVKRLYGVSLVVMTVLLLVIAGPLRLENGMALTDASRLRAALFLCFPLLLPLWVALCGLLAWPIEKGISELYFRDAQRILRERKDDLIRIGITGSWGKTSVKFILGTILEEKYHTLVTPSSYNTPMGVTRVIRTRLEPGHRVFVAEMGARHVGDIRELCRLVHPQLGLLTSVGPQHLDTFKTVERVARTKYELVDGLPGDGCAFFADDGGLCRDLYLKTDHRKRVLCGLDGKADDVWAEEIAYSPEGSTFVLCTAESRTPCQTRLLGELNIRNILLCAGVALHLGLTAEQIARGIAKIEPVEHRLQLIRHPGGPSVIDDAFNSNIQGARQAFRVLRGFPQKRIVVTPGMVELGGQEQALNREFGAAMADCCDVAVLVGRRRSEAILQGLRDAGFDEAGVHVVGSLEEAAALLGTLAGPGDTVLFENDLPDNYSE